MTKDQVIRALLRLPAEEREEIRQLLNQMAENDEGHARLADKLRG